MTLETLPSQGGLEETSARTAPASGFSLHAGVTTKGSERAKLEWLKALTVYDVLRRSMDWEYSRSTLSCRSPPR